MVQDYGKGGGPVRTGVAAGAKGAAAVLKVTAKTIVAIKKGKGK